MDHLFWLEQFLDYLIDKNILIAEKKVHYLESRPKKLSDQLVNDQLISYEDYAYLLSEFLQWPIILLDEFKQKTLILDCISPMPDEMRIYQNDNCFHIIITDITQVEFVELIEFKLSCVCYKHIVIQKNYEKPKIIQSHSDDVIQLIDNIFSYAVKNHISDIHFECFENQLRVRVRIDGLLHIHQEINRELISRVITRIKVLAGLNIAVSNKPQDGRISIETPFGNKEARINICPSLWGEKIVVRMLQDESKLFTLNELGLSETQFSLLQKSLAKPQGMILVTGPTGSGKSATLYAALNALNSTEKNLVSIEDPVEIKIFGINQVAVNRAAELNFATALRAFLRQDPDIMMIGEMRDFETADLAMKAAQTGHLVLSTLHTNNAIETLNRLLHMGITPLNLASSIHLIIAQRLVRKLCEHCKRANQITYEAIGCEHCYQGYRGRLAIFEFLPLAEIIENSSEIIRDHQNLISVIKNYANDSLKQSASLLIQQGLTTENEMQRVI